MKNNLALVQQLTIDTEVLENINDCLNITFGPTGKTGLSFTKKQNFKFLTNGSLLIKSLEFSKNSKNLLLRLLEQAVLKTYTISGDGSSLTLLFACEFLKNSFRYILSGYNSIFISNGLKKIAIFLNEKILEFSMPILSKENLFGLVKTAVGQKIDQDIFCILQEMSQKIARDNILLIEENILPLTQLESVQGLELDKGFASSYFINNLKTFEVVYENPYILVTNRPLLSLNQIQEILEFIKQKNVPLVIVAEETTKELISSLVLMNLQKKIKVVLIKYSSIKFMTTGVLEDLSLLTHSNYSLAELGFSNSRSSENIFFVKDLGQAKKVIIKKEKSIFFISKFAKLITNRRINELTREIILSESEYEKSLLKTRIARLSGKITKIKLGISNQYEITEIKQKVEAIIKTIKSALESGFIAGGGSFSFFIRDEILNWSYLNLIGDEIFAGKIVYDSLVKPFEKLIENNSTNIPENSKVSFYTISEKLKRLGYPYGYNILTNKVVNTFNEGLIDSSKSIRASLWNSLTLISLLITTE